MADALFAASFFNACLRHAEDVGMANIAPLVNTRGPLYVHPRGIVRRTHFHTMAMYANLLGSRVVEVVVEAAPLVHGDRFIPVLDGVVTTDDAGATWSLALVNRHPSRDVACTVTIHDVPLDGRYRATVLSGDSPDSYNDIEHPNRVVPEQTQLRFTEGLGHLPPHSLTIITAPSQRR
jgi:alpha-N-arabinofuranosidase